eukprot:230278-Chlamydomonas_euryale.AAC.4
MEVIASGTKSQREEGGQCGPKGRSCAPLALAYTCVGRRAAACRRMWWAPYLRVALAAREHCFYALADGAQALGQQVRCAAVPQPEHHGRADVKGVAVALEVRSAAARDGVPAAGARRNVSNVNDVACQLCCSRAKRAKGGKELGGRCAAPHSCPRRGIDTGIGKVHVSPEAGRPAQKQAKLVRMAQTPLPMDRASMTCHTPSSDPPSPARL